MSTPRVSVGDRFGTWTVESAGESGWKQRRRWNCICDCGHRDLVYEENLVYGRSTSCRKCRQKKSADATRTHGQSQTPLYKVWKHQSQRCFNPNDAAHKWYGRRGLVMCLGYRSDFLLWKADVGDKVDGKTIDRANNGLGYTCGKCSECLEHGWTMNLKWSTPSEQARNRRSNRIVSFRGKDYVLAALSDLCGVPLKKLWDRIFILGWSVERAATTK